MRRLLALALFLLSAVPVFGTISFVQTSSFTAEPPSTTGTLTISSTANNTLVISSVVITTTATVTGITDSAGNTAWAFQDVKATTLHPTKVEIWTCLKCAAITSVSVHYSANMDSVHAMYQFHEYSGVQAIGTHGNNTGTASTATISLVTQDANNYVVATASIDAAISWTTVTGTIRNTDNIGSSGSFASIDNTAASATTVTCAAGTGSSRDWPIVAVELRSAAPSAAAPGKPIIVMRWKPEDKYAAYYAARENGRSYAQSGHVSW